jgi:hypothetical protein
LCASHGSENMAEAQRSSTQLTVSQVSYQMCVEQLTPPPARRHVWQD